MKIMLFFLTLSSILYAQVPNLINYQGNLNEKGTPLNGTKSIEFQLFADTNSSSIWSETQNISVKEGVFNALLGSKVQLTHDIFNKPELYLGLVINGEVLKPRLRFTSVAYAILAKSVENGTIDSNNIKNGAITKEKLASGISFPPNGTAGGDLYDNYPNPKVGGIHGYPIASTTPKDQQVLKWDSTGAKWIPSDDMSSTSASGGTVTEIIAGDGLTIAGGRITKSGIIDALINEPLWNADKLQGNRISSSLPSNGQVLKWDGSGSYWYPGQDKYGGPPSGPAGGDLSENYPNPTVAKLQGRNISAANPSSGQVLKWSGSQWYPGIDNSGTWDHIATTNIKLNGHYLSGDGDNEGIYINNMGKVGIGITNPSKELEIGNIYQSENHIKINSSDYGGILFSNTLNDWNGGINFYHPKKAFLFDTEGSGSAKMIITGDGKVGIGTGNENNIENLNYKLELGMPNDDKNFMRISSSTWGGIKFYNGSVEPYSGEITYNHPNDYLKFVTKSPNGIRSEKMRISSEGNVGIGTTTPQGTLDVNGSIFQRGGQLHADYVFEDNYNLETIEEHAEFMWKNKHLRAIPKASVDKNGNEIVEVGSYRRGIVEELEKAHIYISQLEQILKKQKQISEELRDRINKIESFFVKKNKM